VDELTRRLLAARDGDRHALAAAVRSSQAEVWRLAAHLVGPEDADDVTQDVFVHAWRALPAFRGDASGRTWLSPSRAVRAPTPSARGSAGAASRPVSPRSSR
jgi:hypothetical protein